MAILNLNMADVTWLEPSALSRSICASSEVRITMKVPFLYSADSKTDLAENWLKTWYMCETLGRHTSRTNCSFQEGELGSGIVVLEMTIRDAEGFANRLLEFGPVFDPDDLEAAAFIYDEAEEWLDALEGNSVVFPELEKCYREDALAAGDEEGYRSELDDVDEQDEG